MPSPHAPAQDHILDRDPRPRGARELRSHLLRRRDDVDVTRASSGTTTRVLPPAEDGRLSARSARLARAFRARRSHIRRRHLRAPGGRPTPGSVSTSPPPHPNLTRPPQNSEPTAPGSTRNNQPQPCHGLRCRTPSYPRTGKVPRASGLLTSAQHPRPHTTAASGRTTPTLGRPRPQRTVNPHRPCSRFGLARPTSTSTAFYPTPIPVHTRLHVLGSTPQVLTGS